MGGDGTWGNVANAIIASGAGVRLALGAAGTGNDFAKTVGAPAHDPHATARLAIDGPDVAVGAQRSTVQTLSDGGAAFVFRHERVFGGDFESYRQTE